MRRYRAIGTAATALLSGALVWGCAGAASAAEPIKMTLGYQSLWATGGEVFEVLRHTNILELNGIKADFKTFTFGGPLGEGAVAGEIDNIFAADAPVLRAMARLPGSKVFHRTHDARFGIMVQPDFQGKLTDLRGKKLSGPFGTTTFPRSVRALIAAGIKDPFGEMTIINQDVAEQVNAMQGKLVDAVTTWDPTMHRMEQQKIGRVLWMAPRGENIGIQGLSGKWLQANGPEGLNKFLKAWIMATWWASNNMAQAHVWFAATSRLSPDILNISAEFDRNLAKPISDIHKVDLMISEQDIQGTQQVMDFLFERKLLNAKMDVRPFFDMEPLKRAQGEIAEGKLPDVKSIRVVAP